MNNTAVYEVFRIPGKFLKNKTEEKMPMSFQADCFGDAKNYAEIKQNAASNISSEIDGVRSYYSTFVIRGRKTTWLRMLLPIAWWWVLIKNMLKLKISGRCVKVIRWNDRGNKENSEVVFEHKNGLRDSITFDKLTKGQVWRVLRWPAFVTISFWFLTFYK